ncbi:hypothetical protein PWT90_07470 [Aphanocladium album]|nr:hypothetical protein PWT90_07470 [Aphanocladium album]
MSESLGPFVHLWGIDPSQVPAENASGAEATPLLTSFLTEALPFISDVPAGEDSAGSSWKYRKSYSYGSSAASVDVYEKKLSTDAMRRVATNYKDQLPQVQPAKVGAETWFLRRSVHEDAAQPKTASWDEFVANFKQHHAESEMAFTEAVVRTTPRQHWDCGGVEVQVGDDTWVDWTLKLEESVHKLPFPLQKRVFPVLQATAAVQGRREIVVVQVFYTGGPAEENAKGTVTGAYTSIERFRELPNEVNGKKQIEWVMGTASDAMGILPEFIQVLATPDMVPKDVDFFLSWVVGQRK